MKTGRLNNILDILLKYTQKDFSDKMQVSELGDELDALSVGLNTMAEEMEYFMEERLKYEKEINKLNADLEKKVKQRTAEIKKLNEELEQKVVERTAQLEAVNKELEAFSYSVSHDLRAPLRAVNGYAQMLNEDYGPKVDEEGRRIIKIIKYNATRMGTLIDELLAFSRLGRKEVVKTEIDMNALSQELVNELSKSWPNRAKIKIGNLHKLHADYGLLRQTMFNLIANAVKYSSKAESPLIEINSEKQNGEIILCVKDNGVGFDMAYSRNLFGVFQRLHSQEEFEGTGVGLALVKRIIDKHGGRVWAEGELSKGATFYFALPDKHENKK